MKNDIIALLNSNPDLTAGEIATKLSEKRSSISKCLTRMVNTHDALRHPRDNGRIEYSVNPNTASIAPTTSSVASSGAVGG